jgi:membrane protease YdiL (CAAX protease family)
MNAEDSPPYPGIWQALWISLEYHLVSLLMLLPLMLTGMLSGIKLEENPATLAVVTLLATAWILRRYQTRTTTGPDVPAGPLPIPLVTILPIAATILGLLLLETPILSWLMLQYPELNPTIDHGFAYSPAGTFMLIVFAAPLTEELLYRGIFLRGFAARYGESRALLFSAGLFALAHFLSHSTAGNFRHGPTVGMAGPAIGVDLAGSDGACIQQCSRVRRHDSGQATTVRNVIGSTRLMGIGHGSNRSGDDGGGRVGAAQHIPAVGPRAIASETGKMDYGHLRPAGRGTMKS